MNNISLVHVAPANWIRLRLLLPSVAFFHGACVSLSNTFCNQVLLGSSFTQLSGLLAMIINDKRRSERRGRDVL